MGISITASGTDSVRTEDLVLGAFVSGLPFTIPVLLVMLKAPVVKSRSAQVRAISSPRRQPQNRASRKNSLNCVGSFLVSLYSAKW